MKYLISRQNFLALNMPDDIIEFHSSALNIGSRYTSILENLCLRTKLKIIISKKRLLT